MKKILIITQKVDRNDSILGFFHRWIEEFSLQYDSVIVICLYAGSYSFNKNVTVHSLGKEEKKSRIRYIYRFYKYIWKFRKEYDVVFVHMNQVYVILGAFVWFFLKKKVALWYVHIYVPFSLRIAEKLTNIIFTSTARSFSLPSKKVQVMGHGIDTDAFAPSSTSVSREINTLRAVTIGRIAPVKRYELMIDAVELLVKKGVPITLDIIGSAVMPADTKYERSLHDRIASAGIGAHIHFVGDMPHDRIRDQLVAHDVFVSMCETGSFDKAVLEAMSCALPVITPNLAFSEMLGPYNPPIPSGDAEALAMRLTQILACPEDMNVLGQLSRQSVIKYHSLKRLVRKIVTAL